MPYAETVWRLLDLKRREGKRILFEGAQGALLDAWIIGNYPDVTSSNTVAAQAATGTGMGPGVVGYVLGICKADTTRCRPGPVPDRTQQRNRRGDRPPWQGVRRQHRPQAPLRRFDAVLVRQTVRTCGITGLALTKPHSRRLRNHRGLHRAMLDGKEIDHLPAGEGAQARVVPIYETIEGWKEPTANARSWADLPAQAIKDVRRVEELVGCPIALLSTSPEREDTILEQHPFEA